MISEFFNIDKKLLEVSNKESSFKKSVDQSRNYWKFWTDQSITKTKKLIADSIVNMESNLTKDYNLLQKLYVKIFNQNNFGVFYYKGNPFFNTIQGQEISNAIVDEQKLPEKNDIIEFSSSLSGTLKTIKFTFDEMLGKPLISDNEDFLVDFNDIDYKDFHLIVDKTNSDDFTLVKQIVMLNILCTINYHQIIAPNYMSKNNDFFFRIRLITYISSCELLRKLINKKEILLSNEEKDTIEQVVSKKESIISSKLRNNIFHYLIDVSQSDASNNLRDFFALSSSIDINYIEKVIDDELKKIRHICMTERFIYK